MTLTPVDTIRTHVNLDIVRVKCDWSSDVRGCVERVCLIDSSQRNTIQLIFSNFIRLLMDLNLSVINSSGNSSQVVSTNTLVTDNLLSDLNITRVSGTNNNLFE